MNLILQQLQEVPGYFFALKGAVAVLAMGLPIYAGLRYFLFRRKLSAPPNLTVSFVGVFLLYAGLAFLLASPLAGYIHGFILTTYLFLTCILTATTIVELFDLFLIQHYLTNKRKIYMSPPLRAVIKLGIFCVAILPILRFVLHFNPLALVAIPTIASAGLAFALQDTLKAFIAGVGLGNIIRLGQWIAYQDKEGRVIDINWARTTLETADRQLIYIPNNLLLTGMFLNYVNGIPGTLRQSFKIGADYAATPAHVKETLLHCVQQVPGVAREPAPQVALLEYADSSIVYGLYYWLDDVRQKLRAQDDVATRVWYAFRRENIAIPYPTRAVQIQKNEPATVSASGIQNSLQQWTLAAAFYAEELQELSHYTRPFDYAPGEVIVQEGEDGDSLFVMVKGSVDVFVAPDSKRPVATLGPHDIFGEMSLLTGAPRSATVRAKSAVELLQIEKAGLQKVMAKRPELSDRLAELISKRKADLASKRSSESGAPVFEESDQTLSKKIRHFFGLV